MPRPPTTCLDCRREIPAPATGFPAERCPEHTRLAWAFEMVRQAIAPRDGEVYEAGKRKGQTIERIEMTPEAWSRYATALDTLTCAARRRSGRKRDRRRGGARW